MDSMWHIVDAMNNYFKLAIGYPSSVEEQEKIVAGLQKVSNVIVTFVWEQLMEYLYGHKNLL